MLRRLVAGTTALLGLALCAAPAGAQVKLAYKFPEKSSTTLHEHSKVHQLLTIRVQEMDAEVPTDSEHDVVVRSTIGARAADGTLPIDDTVESIKMSADLPGGMSLKFDSARPGEARSDAPQLAFAIEILKAVNGSRHRVILDAKNQVKAVEAKTDIKEAELDPKAVAAIKRRATFEKIKEEFDRSHSSLPEGLVRPGETWEISQPHDIGDGQTFRFKNRYEYKGTVEKDGKTLDKISVRALEVTYEQSPEAQAGAKVTKSTLKIDSSDGTILFDREAGRIAEFQSKTRLSGDMTLEVQGMELPTKIDLTLETDLTQKPAETK